MDAVYWFSVGLATGITLTAIELHHRWKRRLDRDERIYRNAIEFERGFGRKMYDEEHAKVNDLRSENIRLHIDLHTAKQNRLEAMKGGDVQ